MKIEKSKSWNFFYVQLIINKRNYIWVFYLLLHEKLFYCIFLWASYGVFGVFFVLEKGYCFHFVCLAVRGLWYIMPISHINEVLISDGISCHCLLENFCRWYFSAMKCFANGFLTDDFLGRWQKSMILVWSSKSNGKRGILHESTK